jgi:hypothetical protein
LAVRRYQALREAARVETASQIEIHQLDDSLIDQESLPMLTNSPDSPNNFVAATSFVLDSPLSPDIRAHLNTSPQQDGNGMNALDDNHNMDFNYLEGQISNIDPLMFHGINFNPRVVISPLLWPLPSLSASRSNVEPEYEMMDVSLDQGNDEQLMDVSINDDAVNAEEEVENNDEPAAYAEPHNANNISADDPRRLFSDQIRRNARAFETYDDCRQHLDDDGKKLKCAICNRSFDSPWKALEHLTFVHYFRFIYHVGFLYIAIRKCREAFLKHKCLHCMQEFKNHQELSAHLRDVEYGFTKETKTAKNLENIRNMVDRISVADMQAYWRKDFNSIGTRRLLTAAGPATTIKPPPQTVLSVGIQKSSRAFNTYDICSEYLDIVSINGHWKFVCKICKKGPFKTSWMACDHVSFEHLHRFIATDNYILIAIKKCRDITEGVYKCVHCAESFKSHYEILSHLREEYGFKKGGTPKVNTINEMVNLISIEDMNEHWKGNDFVYTGDRKKKTNKKSKSKRFKPKLKTKK